MSMQKSTTESNPPLNGEDRFLHLKSIDVSFREPPHSKIEIMLSDASLLHKSPELQAAGILHWDCDVYVKANTSPLLTVQKPQHGIHKPGDLLAEFNLDFKLVENTDAMSFEQKHGPSGVTIKFVLGNARSTADVTRLLATEATMALSTKVKTLENFDRVKNDLDFVVETGTATKLFPPSKRVVRVVAMAYKRLQGISECHHNLVLTVDDVASVLPSMEMAIKLISADNVRDVIYQYLEIVRNLSDSIIRADSSSGPDIRFRNRFKPRFNDLNDLRRRVEGLQSTLRLALGGDTRNEVSDIRRHQLTEEDERLLERLNPPRYSSYDLSRCCLAGTRTSVLKDVVHWATSKDDSSRLFWLHGVAGCGKSSVAASVCSTLEKQAISSFSFFCKRDDPERRSAARLIQALAYFLAKAIEPYRAALAQELKKDLSILDKPFPNQIGPLFLDHKGEISSAACTRPIVIVLDALDECSETETVSAFLMKFITLVPSIKLIVTSRPLLGIERELQSSETLVTPCDLFKISAEDDILAYAKHRFDEDKNLADLRGDVAPVEIEELAQKALGLFSWISVVCSHISNRRTGRLKVFRDILQSTGAPTSEKRLDELYLQILKHAAGSEETDTNKDGVRLIVGLISATSRNRTLPADALFAFGRSKFPGSTVEWDGILQDLRSVLPIDTQTHAIRACHKSFLDFLGDRSRSEEFWTDSEELDRMMAEKCIQIMLSGLKFNICGLKSSYCPNSDADDPRIDEHIPQELQYSCLYWLDHLSRCKDGLAPQNPESLRQELRELLCRDVSLYWLEVMSLLSELREAVVIIGTLSGMLKAFGDEDKLCAFTADLRCFVEAFYEPMATSAPHIYISALSWAPSESLIAKSIGSVFNSQACLADGRDRFWFNDTQKISLDSGVYCVAYSPNGRFIVTGCEDHTIRILDAHTGVPIVAPLRGHEDAVMSVDYSPDGLRIVSSSLDKTIRIWDAVTGAPVGKPLVGHELDVWSAKYSPDGRRIVSGSDDMTIRIWDAATGASLGEPLRGHEDYIQSVAFSPDGRWIVSGSGDKTIRIWDAETGASVGEPLVGHGDAVLSVNYSPDGLRIVSGSADNTLRIWDAETGRPIGEPLRGHKDWVWSVRYSPDGRRIASGSSDSTIQIWEAQTGLRLGDPLAGHEKTVWSVNYSPDGLWIVSGSDDKTVRIWVSKPGPSVGEPLRGHEDAVLCADYSPDGRWIVSSSSDKTIRFWDAVTGAPVGKPLEGHEDLIFSVHYSPDGRWIVSGSDDKTIRIWDAATGAPVGEPLRGHEDYIQSVAFSPDGRWIVSGSGDKTIRIWDAKTGASVGEPLVGHEDAVFFVSYSPDGRQIVSGSADKTIRIWDAETGRPVGEPFRGHDEWVWSVGYSPDGHRIVSGSMDRTIRIWDAVTGAPVRQPIEGHEGSVLSVNYSPDGRWIVSGSEDKTIRVWGSESGAPVGVTLRGHEDLVESVNYSPDGRRVVSGSDDRTVRIWDVDIDTPFQPIGEWKYRPDEDCFVLISSAAGVSDAGVTARSRTPQHVLPDGWIRTVDDGLLLWIPPKYRRNVCDMSLMCISRNPNERPVRINWKKLCSGTAWSNGRKGVVL